MWYGFGVDLVWICHGFGTILADLVGFGLDLVWIWYGFGRLGAEIQQFAFIGIVLGGNPAVRSHRVEQFTAL